jgi:hypothetical protein
MNTMGRVLLHDVPKNWLATDFDHRLGLEVRLLTDSGAQATSQNNCLHLLPSYSALTRPGIDPIAMSQTKNGNRAGLAPQCPIYGDAEGNLQETRQLGMPERR